MRLMIVELSLNVRSMVVIAASGPLTRARAAACGIYVKTNIKAITAVESVRVGTSFASRGFHRDLWLMK
jgi:hypothetical protein